MPATQSISSILATSCCNSSTVDLYFVPTSTTTTAANTSATISTESSDCATVDCDGTTY